jgi:2-oxo-4-hydroxy-4-carboxy--5-ureidoimidazoline (OHCU) decarboxylase
MSYHPHLAAALAEARTADLHAAAARGRHDAHEKDASHAQQPPSAAYTWLDAYPRLCGLPVTIERLATNSARPAEAAGVDERQPAFRNENSTAKKHWWRRPRPHLS